MFTEAAAASIDVRDEPAVVDPLECKACDDDNEGHSVTDAEVPPGSLTLSSHVVKWLTERARPLLAPFALGIYGCSCGLAASHANDCSVNNQR